MIAAGYTGAVSLLLHLIPLLEKTPGSRGVVIGSVAGDRGRRSNYVYGSVKAGLATFTEGLRSRLYAAKVPVLLVKPGFLDTRSTWGMGGTFLFAAPQDAAKVIVRRRRRGRIRPTCRSSGGASCKSSATFRASS